MNFKYIITGADGYIGSHMAYRLLKNGATVMGIDRQSTQNTKLLQEKYPLYDFVESDIRNVANLPKCETLLHFASLKSVPQSRQYAQEYYQNNIFAFIDFFRNSGIECDHVILSSSAGVYSHDSGCSLMGNGYHVESERCLPEHPYGISKLILEEFLKYEGISHTSLRYFNPMGSSDLVEEPFGAESENLLPKLLHAYKTGMTFYITGTDYQTSDGSCTRDFIHIEDLIDAHELFCLNRVNGVFNVGTGHGYTVKQIVDAFQQVNDIKLQVNNAPRRGGDPDVLMADTTRISELGFKCRKSLEDMVRLPSSLRDTF